MIAAADFSLPLHLSVSFLMVNNDSIGARLRPSVHLSGLFVNTSPFDIDCLTFLLLAHSRSGFGDC